MRMFLKYVAFVKLVFLSVVQPVQIQTGFKCFQQRDRNALERSLNKSIELRNFINEKVICLFQ